MMIFCVTQRHPTLPFLCLHPPHAYPRFVPNSALRYNTPTATKPPRHHYYIAAHSILQCHAISCYCSSAHRWWWWAWLVGGRWDYRRGQIDCHAQPAPYRTPPCRVPAGQGISRLGVWACTTDYMEVLPILSRRWVLTQEEAKINGTEG